MTAPASDSLPDYVGLEDFEQALDDYALLEAVEWRWPLVAGGLDEQPMGRLYDALTVRGLAEIVRRIAKQKEAVSG